MDIMSRPPRNSQNEHLVSRKVFSFAYFQIGVLEAAAGFFAYFIVMGDHGFYISDLFQIRSYWDDKDTLLIDRQHRRWVILAQINNNLNQFFLLPRHGMTENNWNTLVKQHSLFRLLSANGPMVLSAKQELIPFFIKK